MMIVLIVSLAAVVLVIAGYVIFSKTQSLFMFKLINKIFDKEGGDKYRVKNKERSEKSEIKQRKKEVKRCLRKLFWA